jgi:hypothetical protein
VSLDRQAPPNVARAMTRLLVGDSDWSTPVGTPAYSYFATMTLEAALEEFDQIYQLPEASRMRDLLERLGEDGSATSEATR